MNAVELPRSIATTLTPSGRGAVAVIGIRGPLAEAALAKHFQRSGSSVSGPESIVARSVSEGVLSPSLTRRGYKKR